uniref:Uncharacterized protein n=1 Tax=Sorangium cellulosum TaxID=56 RepID=Q9L8C1_SORCE|nr:unknown [Sorangium cellulosum]
MADAASRSACSVAARKLAYRAATSNQTASFWSLPAIWETPAVVCAKGTLSSALPSRTIASRTRLSSRGRCAASAHRTASEYAAIASRNGRSASSASSASSSGESGSSWAAAGGRMSAGGASTGEVYEQAPRLRLAQSVAARRRDPT